MGEKKKGGKKIIFYICFSLVILLLGFFGGFLLGEKMEKSSLSFEMSIFTIVLYIFIFYFAFIIQIIIHEAGHLIFGLLSGYEFISFRVGSITIVKDQGKFKLKKFKIKGTGGQCLMMPKTNNYEEINYLLYNLGGILMNFIASIICLLILILVDTNQYIKVMLSEFILIGVICVISNGIPMKLGGISNDGYNTMSISRDKFIKYCFYIQLKVNGLLSKGMRFKDMPIEWFHVKEGADLNNHFITFLKIMEANYYQDKLDFNLAKECYENILYSAPNIIKLYENEIKCELLFYEILNGNMEKVDELYTKELRNYIKITDCYISRKRLMYVYNLIVLRDKEKADKVLGEFEKLKNSYPIKGDIESEEEIMNFILDNVKVV
ncbi:MAG: site-2 protease family protein [Clostridium celatum]|nr:site-2 protease family protein [Clostridium celatum]